MPLPRALRSAPFRAAALCAALASPLAAQPPELLLRVDDIGMSHAVNQALENVAAMKVRVSASVMFACPWYQEAVEILRRNPHVSVGVHLTLNSEWKGYRWGPVLGRTAVPTLVDSVGYFLPSSAAFLARKYDLAEVERELSAQVDRAVKSGLKIDYVDYHMGTAVSTPQLGAVVERVAEKYGLGVSRYFGEAYHTMFDTPPDEKSGAFLAHLGRLAPGTLNLVVVHAAEGTPELGALYDMNNASQNVGASESLVARHRSAELAMLLSPEFARLRDARAVTLVHYGDVIARKGRAPMRRPAR